MISFVNHKDFCYRQDTEQEIPVDRERQGYLTHNRLKRQLTYKHKYDYEQKKLQKANKTTDLHNEMN